MNWKDELLNPYRFRVTELTDEVRKELSDKTDVRSALESDFGRVVFSPACRRLHDKTQVFPLTTNDNIHSRLTHSLEVMNMGLSFSINLSKNEKFKKHTGLDEVTILRGIGAILKTVCLVHDIGNPPFGHFGEEVIQDFYEQLFKKLEKDDCELRRGIAGNQLAELKSFLSDNNRKYDYTQFDGNAEGLRILTKLQYLGDLHGLNLTYATLGASVKYPNLQGQKKDGAIGQHKHGVMTTERREMEKIAEQCGLCGKVAGIFLRHPLAFLMEAADSICYLVMDLDDARQRKWITTKDVWDIINTCEDNTKNAIGEMYNKIIGDNKNQSKEWMCLRTSLLSYLAKVALDNFVEKLPQIESGDYNEELIEDGNDLSKRLLDFSRKKILFRREINSLETTGKAVISGLLDQYIDLMFHPEISFRNRAKALMSRSILHTVIAEHIRDYEKLFKEKYGEKNSEEVFDDFDLGDLTVEERLRAIRDYVAGMTDKFALNHYKELSGQRLS